MESLPAELFENIFAHITDRPDILSLRAVNKFFNARFTSLAFRRTKRFQNTTDDAFRLHIITKSTHIAPCITNLQFDMDYRYLQINNDHILKTGVITGLRKGLSSIAVFTNVKSISFNFPSVHTGLVDSGARKVPIECRFQNIILKIFSLNLGTISPTSFEITKLQLYDWEHFKTSTFQRFLGGLTSLSINIVYPKMNADLGVGDNISHFISTFAQVWLKPTEASLESLKLDFKLEICHFDHFLMQFAHLRFLKLKKLDLYRFLINPDDAELLITSTPNLERLLLVKCAVSYRNQQHIRNATWADILRTFQKNLKSLKYFDMMPSFRYYTLTELFGYRRCNPKHESPNALKDDLKALWELRNSTGQIIPTQLCFFDPLPDVAEYPWYRTRHIGTLY